MARRESTRRILRKCATGAAFLGTCVGVGGAKNAQAQVIVEGFASNRFEPAAPDSSFFLADQADIRGPALLRLRAVGDWAVAPVTVVETPGGETSKVLQHQAFAHWGVSLGLLGRMRASLSLPVQVFAVGDGAIVGFQALRGPTSTVALGDLRLGFDGRVWGREGGPFVAALGLRGWVPTGNAGAYAGDGAFRFAPRAMVSGEFGRGRGVYGAQGGLVFRSDKEFGGETIVGREVSASGGVGMRLVRGRLLVGPEIQVTTLLGGSSAPASPKATTAEALLGVHWSISPRWGVAGGVGTALTGSVGAPAFRGLLALEFTPMAPAVAPAMKVALGESVPGVVGPSTAAADRDGDGIEDARDACPDTKGEGAAEPGKHGCPRGQDADGDGDGIPDEADACPLVAGVKSDDGKLHGCPATEATPAAPPELVVPPLPTPNPAESSSSTSSSAATATTPSSAAAKAEIVAVPVAGFAPKPVYFRMGSSSLSRESQNEQNLQEILKYMQSHPEVRLRVEGHADEVGLEETNASVSLMRATRVARWFLDHGLAPSRMTTVAYGKERLVTQGDPVNGRKANRRVEFVLEAAGTDKSTDKNTDKPSGK